MAGRRFGISVRVLTGMVLVGMLAFGAVRPAHASLVIYVKRNASGNNDGTSWADAYTNLRTAINSAGAGQQVWVAAGTYKPTTTTNRAYSFELKSGVAVYGGFAGTETMESQRNPALHPTILSGDIGSAGVFTDNSYHVVVGSGADQSAVLSGFTITGGYANAASGTGDDGGGMLVDTGAPSVSDIIFTGNTATEWGGGLFNNNSNPTIENSTFVANKAAAGGGLANYSSGANLINVTFRGNTAPGSFANGGGMVNIGGSPTITNATFSGNNAGFHGDAMYDTFGSTPYIYDSIFWSDGTEEIFNNSASPTISNSIVKGGCPAGAVCTLVSNADPKLGALQNNGGFTTTMALGGGSAAIDRGDNGTCATTDQREVARPQGPRCDMGAYEVKALSFASAGGYDGWVLESGENTSVGGSRDSSSTTLRVGDDGSNRQYRGLLSFKTASLPDGSTVVLARLRIEKAGLSPVNPFSSLGSLLIDLKKPYFGSALGLELGDFQASAGVSPAGSIGSTLASGWYTGLLNSSGRAAVNKTGTTQLRLRFSTDDNNNHAADYLPLYSGNAASSDRPRLIVYYNP